MWVAACDDDPRFEQWLKETIPPMLQPEDEFTTYKSGAALLDAIGSAGRPVDVLLLDMEMHGIDGLQTAAELRQTCPDTIIIVISTYRSYALPAYEIKAFHYLVKPVNAHKLMVLLNEARQMNRFLQSDVLCIRNRQDIVYLPVREVLYVASRDRALFAHTHGQQYRFPGSLHTLIETIGGKGFSRCHKSYIVNLAYVQYLNKAERYVRLSGNVILPVGNRRIEALASAILNYRKNN